MNPFAKLYRACNSGTNEDKYVNLPLFPRLIDAEVTNACNFRCLMCPTGNKAMTRPSGFMAPETFARLAEQCPEGTGLRFIGWGEPTLHPELPAFIRDAERLGLPTHLNTNGSHLQRLMVCVEAGLSSVKFSFQGVDRESYAEMRNIDFYERLRATVRIVHGTRGDSVTPYIHVSTTTTHETPDQVTEFRRAFADIADSVSVGKTIFSHMDMKAIRLRPHERERLERLRVFEPELHHPVPCPEVNDKLTVQWDGSVRVCCNDHSGVTDLGNINDRQIAHIWRDKTIEDYRQRLARGEYAGPLCSNCWDYMGTTA